MAGPMLRCASPWGTTLTLTADALVVRGRKGGEETIPLSQIRKVRLDPPHGIEKGCLRVTRLVGEEEFAFRRTEFMTASAVHAGLMGMLGPTEEARGPGLSVADELMKLKGLLDGGALTSEEFEAAKKKLLE